MMKYVLLAVALLSLALAAGCAKGGNGIVAPPVTVMISPATTMYYPTQSVTLTAKVEGTSNTAVTWSLSGTGTLTPVTPPTTPASATYVAPAPVGSQAVVTATSAADTSVKGTLTLSVIDITTEVTPAALSPATLSVGSGLTQQFAAVAIPDSAPQTFTWTCTANGVPCANFVQDATVSGLATYTAQDSCSGSCIQISAASTLDPPGCAAVPANCTAAKASLVTSRLSGTYAFQFSGYDNSNHATAAVGTFTASANGTITAGTEEELTSGGWASHPITGGSYAPITASDPNSNNAGLLTLTGASPNKFQVVLDGNGDIQMIEADGNGTGSGSAQIATASPNQVFKNAQTFAFGFTGFDASGKRVGYVGVLPMNTTSGSGTVSGGQIDVNDNGQSSNAVCNAAPCTVTGSYSPNGSGSYRLTLTAPVAMTFDLYIAAGSGNKSTPLTFYAISTDPSSNPAVSGTLVLQDSTLTYNNAAFKSTSVSALTGVNGANSNVALTLGTADGSGNFSGQFDQNNAGTILSAINFPNGSASYTYAASGTKGRYTFNMLGNPGGSPVVAPVPFVLYASGANRGFLLDQSSSSVMAGTMTPQGKGSGNFSASTFPGTYAAASTSSGGSAVDPIAANLLLTFVDLETSHISGTEYPGPLTLSGSLAVPITANNNGTGTVLLTAPSSQNYVIYAVETSNCTPANPVCAIESFLMMNVDSTNPNASIILAQQ